VPSHVEYQSGRVRFSRLHHARTYLQGKQRDNQTHDKPGQPDARVSRPAGYIAPQPGTFMAQTRPDICKETPDQVHGITLMST
jgi:hypothetical protein